MDPKDLENRKSCGIFGAVETTASVASKVPVWLNSSRTSISQPWSSISIARLFGSGICLALRFWLWLAKARWNDFQMKYSALAGLVHGDSMHTHLSIQTHRRHTCVCFGSVNHYFCHLIAARVRRSCFRRNWSSASAESRR